MDPHLYHAHLDTLRQVPRSPVQQDDEFAAFTAYDYGRRRRLHPDVAWEDACRAYAFAAASGMPARSTWTPNSSWKTTGTVCVATGDRNGRWRARCSARRGAGWTSMAMTMTASRRQ